MESRPARSAIVFASLLLLLWSQVNSGRAEDQIDLLLRDGKVPKTMLREHGYSDFTDPIGKFLDLLAAGSFAEARTLQPGACAAWLATRQDSPLTGRFRIWDTEIDLDTLCAQRRETRP